MKRTLVSYLSVLMFLGIWFMPMTVVAKDATADAFMNYTNPHDICDYYRASAPNFRVERESDNECLVSLGSGQYKGFTQYYYSGNNWCYKIYSGSEVVHSNCVAIPSSNAFSDFNFHIDSENMPYIIAGGSVLVFVIVVGSISSAARARAAKTTAEANEEAGDKEKTFNPKVKRSGKASYGWEEMETSTTEEINAKPPKGPGEGQSQGGVGLHQGEPIVHSTANELEKLVRLRDKGVLSQKEFNLAKKKLLK